MAAPTRVGEVFTRPSGANVYIMHAYKGVGADGVDDPAQFTLPTDFSAVPGGGGVIEDGLSRRIGEGIMPGSWLVFKDSGAPVTIYFDVSI
jgi:hypothetical protein